MYVAWGTPTQAITSADTSINSSKLPATLNSKHVHFEPGTLNADIGGGRFDNATEHLLKLDVVNVIYDPYNRSIEHNNKASKILAKGICKTATINNVLNVIKEKDSRKHVIIQAYTSLNQHGRAYFLLYEGNKSGVGKETSKGWQENRKAESYISEIKEIFPQVVKLRGNILVAYKK